MLFIEITPILENLDYHLEKFLRRNKPIIILSELDF